MLARRPGKESSMDTQDSSTLKPPPDVKEEGSSEGAASGEASQGNHKPNFLEYFRRSMNRSKAKEVQEEEISGGGTTDKASQDNRKPTFVEDFLKLTNQLRTNEVHEEGSSKGTAIYGASQDERKRVLKEYLGITNQSDTIVQATAAVNEKYRQLFEAAVEGDWENVKKFLDIFSEAAEVKVMTKKDKSLTVLDVAVMAAQDEVVENLLKHLPLNYDSMIIRRAFFTAARKGRIRMVKALEHRINNEPESVGSALWYAISKAPMRKEVIWYLASRTKSAPSYEDMSSLIMAGHMDIVLYLFWQFHSFAISKDNSNLGLLGNLAKMKSCFRSAAELNFWEKSIDKCRYFLRFFCKICTIGDRAIRGL
ncbi:hypothetical protein BT93_C0756 [Corymbia citriodora subsp. variegata]|nr:hypothetical protein BT93_C0756 [Corymbia citriodora subsp. variegata]KAF8034535.1 hypothetical protein BT93_C0756 [Corymbia citriodora subsp. variegata]KAF8034536.1 hypothetical protein BT93_C0756 [Corymbia citriodora subsp. variegata]